MSLNMLFKLIDIARIAAAKGRSRRALTEHMQPRQWMNIKTRKKESPTFMLGDTPSALSTRSTSTEKQDPQSHLHPTETVKVDLKLEEVLYLEAYFPPLIFISHYNYTTCQAAR